MDQENGTGLGGILVLIMDNHSWLELIYLYLAIHVAIPNKPVESKRHVIDEDLMSAMLSKWPNDLLVKLLAPIILILYILILSIKPLLYSSFGMIPFIFIADVLIENGKLFDPLQMVLEAALICTACWALCQISLTFKKIDLLRSDKAE